MFLYYTLCSFMNAPLTTGVLCHSKEGFFSEHNQQTPNKNKHNIVLMYNRTLIYVTCSLENGTFRKKT